MDLTLANSEPFVLFHDFLEDFDRNIKATYGALVLAGQMPANSTSSTGDGLVRLPTEDEPWGGETKWRNLDKVVKSSQLFIAQIGLIRIFSAFDYFLNGVRAEYDRFKHITAQNGSITSLGGEYDDVGLRQLSSYINLQISSLEPSLTVFDYFVLLRNCLAHRSGRASSALVLRSSLPELRFALQSWPVRQGKALPELPQIVKGKQIPLLARHAIFAGVVCRGLAQVINDHLVAHIGPQGIVFMAAHHFLLAEEPTLNAPRRDAEAVVNQVLSGRYRVREFTAHQTIRILKNLDRWKECKERFRQLYSKSSP